MKRSVLLLVVLAGCGGAGGRSGFVASTSTASTPSTTPRTTTPAITAPRTTTPASTTPSTSTPRTSSTPSTAPTSTTSSPTTSSPSSPSSSPSTTPSTGTSTGTTPPGSTSSTPSTTPNTGTTTTPTPAPAHELQVSGWAPYWGTPGTSVRANAGKGLDEVDTFWYALNADATLAPKTGARDASLITAIHNNHALIVPTVFDLNSSGNGTKCVNDPALRAKLVKSILHEVDTYHYDGFDIDFEALKTADRAGMSAFMEDLAKELHARKKVLSICAVPKLQDKPSWGAAGALDYPALGKVVDRFKMMTYGQHGSWSGPGPIGDNVSNAKYLDYALKSIPAEKIYLGIPFYGYDWPDNGAKATAVTFSTVQSRIAKSTSGVTFSTKDGECTFTYTEAGVKHTVWFSDERAIAAKEALAKKYKIGGVACWAIGGEGQDFFNTLDKGR